MAEVEGSKQKHAMVEFKGIANSSPSSGIGTLGGQLWSPGCLYDDLHAMTVSSRWNITSCAAQACQVLQQ